MLLHTYVFYYVYSYPIVPTYSPLSSTKICVEPSIFKYASMFFFFEFSPEEVVEPQNFLSHDWYWLGPSSLSFRRHYHHLPISTDSIRILYHEVSLYTVCTHFDWVKTCMKRASIAQGSPVPKLMPFSTIWSCGAPTKGILTWVF